MRTDFPDLPPVEAWWPYLSIGARHRLMRHPWAPLDDRLRGEVEAVTGRAAPPGAGLTEDDRRFVEMQRAMSE